jgi:hypothetical protein
MTLVNPPPLPPTPLLSKVHTLIVSLQFYFSWNELSEQASRVIFASPLPKSNALERTDAVLSLTR